MTTTNSQPAKRQTSLLRRIFKGILWALGLLLGLVALIVAILAISPDARRWTSARLLTDPVLNDRLAGIPVRSAPQPVKLYAVRMRDGTKLSTQVYLPKGEGPWPVIIVRDPYSFAQYGSCHVWVRYDYACVYQEVRGRGPSEGKWYPFIDERKDGLDLIAWILQQPWQDRKLALQGGSYLGVVQWAVAGEMPPEVKTFVPTVAHGDVYQLAYRNGAFNEGIAGFWLHNQFRSPIESLHAAWNWNGDIAGHFPALGVDPEEFGKTWGAYRDYLMHPEPEDPYWQSKEYVGLRNAHRSVNVPVLMIGYANDFFLPGMLTTYDELPTRDKSLFVIGPGNHGGGAEDEVRGSYRGDYADTLAWFDHHLRGQPLPERLNPGVKVFVHGANTWRRFSRWPHETELGSPTRLVLDNLQYADSCEDGTMRPGSRPTGASIQFIYDPRNPVPTRGGPFELIGDAVENQGTDLCERPDVLSFATDQFADGALINGSIEVVLDVASSAEDTTFTVKLSEHFPDGRIYNIRDDISTLSLRNGVQRALRYQPGDRVEVVFNLTPILWRLAKGSRLRLDISSSSAPAFFPHPNRAGLWSTVDNPTTATQTLYGGTVALPLTEATKF